MVIYRIRRIDVDGGKLGKVWKYYYFKDRTEAKSFYQKLIDDHNEFEKNRNINIRLESRLFQKDIIEDVSGFVCWQYTIMLILDTIEVK